MRIENIVKQYAFLQIAKINDSKAYSKDYNLSLEYFVIPCLVKKPDYYNKFLNDNKEFIKAIKTPRNKVIAHADRNVYTSGAVVGAFSSGLDDKYFDSLHKVISERYKELDLGPFPEWPSFIETDTKIFMNNIEKAFRAEKKSRPLKPEN